MTVDTGLAVPDTYEVGNASGLLTSGFHWWYNARKRGGNMTIAEWHNDTIGGRTVESLKKNGFTAAYFANREDAADSSLNL